MGCRFGSLASILDRSVGILFLWLGVALIFFYACAAIAGRRGAKAAAPAAAAASSVPVKTVDSTVSDEAAPSAVTVA